MKLSDSEKEILKKEIKSKISKGLSKQSIYDELIEDHNDRGGVAEIIDDFVSKGSKRKYKIQNTILLILLVLIGILDLNFGLKFLMVDLILIYAVASYNFQQYILIAIRGFFGIIVLGLYLLGEETSVLEFYYMLSVFIIVLTSFILGYKLSNLLSIKGVMERENYIDDDGENRWTIRHKFVD